MRYAEIVGYAVIAILTGAAVGIVVSDGSEDDAFGTGMLAIVGGSFWPVVLALWLIRVVVVAIGEFLT